MTKSWMGLSLPGNWSLSANWSPSGPPGPSDTALFNNSYPCTLDVNASVKFLQFSSYSGAFYFLSDTLRVTDSADFLGGSGAIIPGNGALEFIGSGSSSLIPRPGLGLPTIIQSGSGVTFVKTFGCKAAGLVVKNGVFNCGSVFEDTILGTASVTGGALVLGSAGLRVNEMMATGGTIDFAACSLTVVGSTNNYLQFDNVNPGAGRINLRQAGYWHFLYPPVNAQLPQIYKYGADSLELMGALKTKALYLFNGSWHWGGSGGRVHYVDTLQTSGGTLKMLFSTTCGDSVKTIGNINLSGLASVDGITAGAGCMVINGSAGYQQLTPFVDHLLPAIRHTGTATLMISANLLCRSFYQSDGTLNTNGFNITASESFTIVNGTSVSVMGLGTGIDSITAQSATLKGLPGDSLNLDRPNTWKFHVNGALYADYVKLRSCNAACSTGFANNSNDLGNNPNWKFGKFWRGSAVDSQWTTSYNWAPPGAPLTSDSIVFDNCASTGCILNGSAAVRAVKFAPDYTKQFDFTANSLAIYGTADFMTSGIIVPGTGSIQLASSQNSWFYHRSNNPLPKILKTGSGSVYMSDTVRLMTPLVSVSDGVLGLYKPIKVDSLYVANPGTIMFDDAIARKDTIRAIAGNGNVNLGWVSLYVSGNADLYSCASTSVTDRSKLFFIGNNPHAFSPPLMTTFPYIGAIGNATTTVSNRGLSMDTLDVESGTFNFGASLVDTLKAKLIGEGTLDFASCTLVVKTDSIKFDNFAAIAANAGLITFAGASADNQPQVMTPKAGVMLPTIICNNYFGLSVIDNPLKANALQLQMGTVLFPTPAVFRDTLGAISTIISAVNKGINFGNDTINVTGSVDLTDAIVQFQSDTAALRFVGTGQQSFAPSAVSNLPRIFHCGSGAIDQSGPLKCHAFCQTAGVYRLNGQKDTITGGDFTIVNGTGSSLTGLGGAAIVAQYGNAYFSGQSASFLNLFPASTWRLDVAGNKTAQNAIIGSCNAAGGPAGIPTSCAIGAGNTNWDTARVLPHLFDTLGTVATINASQRAGQSDTADIYYQLLDVDNPVDTITVRYRNGISGQWLPITFGSGDIGVVAAADSSVHRHIRWNIAGQFGGGFASDSIQLSVTAVDNCNNSAKLLSAAANMSLTVRIPELTNNLVIHCAGIGDSAIAVSWTIDASKADIPNVLFGFSPDRHPDTNALTRFPYRDTSFIIAPALLPGTWRFAMRLIDFSGRISALRTDSVVIANIPPLLTVVNDTMIDRGTRWFGRLACRDRNGDSVRFRMVRAPSGLALDSVQGTMEWTPGSGDTGTFSCIVNAYDFRGGNAADTFSITVRTGTVDAPPTITFIGDSIAREDSLFMARIIISDPDAGDSAWFSIVKTPVWMRFSADTLWGIPAADNIGTDTISLTARDRVGKESAITKKIIVVHTNHAPQIISWIGPDTMRQYGNAQWSLSVIDKDKGDSLSIVWLAQPAWMGVTGALKQGNGWNGIFTATPLSTDRGWVKFAFMIRDFAGASASIKDSVFVIGLPITVITKRQVAFGAVSYAVATESGSQPAVSFDASLRSLSDTMFSMAKNAKDGNFEFYPLIDGRYEFTASSMDAQGLRDATPRKDTITVSGASRHAFRDTSWTMVSVPGVPYAAAFLAKGGHLLHWDETSVEDNVYRYYRRESTISRTTPGLSYWRKSSDSLIIDLESRDLRDSAFSISLGKGAYGWNQIASPYPYPVKWPNGATLWKWDGAINDYTEAGGVLEPWQGYWVLTDSSAVMRIDNTPVYSTGAAAKRSFAYFVNNADWRIGVSLKSEGGNDADNTFGFSPGAKDEYDINDRPEPPRLPDNKYAFFWHPEWNRGVKEFASDVRRHVKRTNIFQIGVSPSQSQNGAVRFRFYGIETLPTLYCFLADADTVFRIDGKKEYEFASSGSTVFKTVFVTADRNFINNYPFRFAFPQPFPNPCRPMAIISYTLPYRFARNGLLNEAPYRVRMALFDAMGRQVRQLVNKEQEPGSYRMVWDGKSVSGKIVAPGVYFCRLEANEYSSIVRMTMLR